MIRCCFYRETCGISQFVLRFPTDEFFLPWDNHHGMLVVYRWTFFEARLLSAPLLNIAHKIILSNSETRWKNTSFGPVEKNLLVTIDFFLVSIVTWKKEKFFRLVWTDGYYRVLTSHMKTIFWWGDLLWFSQWRSLTHDTRSKKC